MSHGPAADSTIEPNLTPLLDLVLQLLMYFMITVNFTQGVTNTGETLPHSETISTVAGVGGEPIILSVKPFRMAATPSADPTKGPRDDFRAFPKDDHAKLRGRFQDGEVCV